MKVLAAVAAALVLAASSVPSAAKSGKSIVEVAAAQGVFGTLLAAATAAGFADDLDEVDGLTVFAPTDAAFDKLPHGTVDDLLKPENKDALRAIIAYHIVPGRVPAQRISTKFKLVETLNGCERVKTKRSPRNGRVTVDGVRVVKANVRAENGIIHVIDEVLLPARACP